MERLILWHRILPPVREEDDDPGATAQWARTVAARFQAAGGTPMGTLGSAVAAAFDPPDMHDALDLALGLLDEADRQQAPVGGVPITIGAAMGEVEEVVGPAGQSVGWVGAALDRAQHLANRARAGELVLDASVREAAKTLYLFDRPVGAGPATHRGQTIDRTQPRRDSCRRFIRNLRPPSVAPRTAQSLAPMRDLAKSAEGARVLLRGPPGAGAGGWLTALERELRPPRVLRLRGVPGALEPLGSLRFMLLAHWKRADGVERALGALELDVPDAPAALASVARGESVDRALASSALASLLRSVPKGSLPPWMILDPAVYVDPATLSVVSDAADLTPTMLVARLPVDSRTPKPFVRDGVTELILPALRAKDAAAVAASMLGVDPGSELARRVGVLAGDTPLGVEEATRTLVASGDLLYEDDQFDWRVAPRAGVQAIGTDALLRERLHALEEEPRRVLEAVCVVPEGTPLEWITAVSEADGVPDKVRERSMELLRLEAYLASDGLVRARSSVLRRVVLEAMPPSRSAELHRFTAEMLQSTGASKGSFGHATLGYYEAEGGHPREGARALLVAGQAAHQAGFGRAAVRLAAAAVQIDPSPETRAAASELARRVGVQPSRPPGKMSQRPSKPVRPSAAPQDDNENVLNRAVSAMMQRDFETVERCIDMATAEGRDRSAAQRMRALAHLARGDHTEAMRALASLQPDDNGDHRAAARRFLTRALVLLHSGDAPQAVREALAALSTSRRIKDPRGEAAAMHTLSWCFRALGRDKAAEVIEEASPG